MASNFNTSLSLDITPFLNALKKAAAESGLAADKIEASFAGIDPKITIDTAKVGAEGTKAAQTFGAKFKDAIKGGGLGDAFAGGLIGGGVAGIVSTAAGAIVGGIKSAIDAGAAFETGLASLQAVTGASGSALVDLGDRAKNLSEQFGGEAVTQLGAFQTILSKFGPDLVNTPEALGKVSENVNILAKAAGLDAKQSVDALSNSLLQFGVDASDPARLAEESGRFINVLAASAKVGAAEIPQVAEAILQAGVAAKGANLSFEETNAAIQALAVGGKVGSEAGVSLRNVIGLLIKQSGPGEEALKKVGLSAAGLGQTLTTQGLAAALEQLQGGISKLGSDAEKAAFKATLFGTENASAAGILLDGVENIKTFTEGVTGTQEATTQAAVNMATFSEAMSRAGAVIQNVGISAFTAIKDFVTFLFARLKPVIDNILPTFQGALERIWAILKPILALLGGAIIATVITMFTYLSEKARLVVQIFVDLYDATVEAFQPLMDLFGGVGEGVDIMQTFTDILDAVVLTITEVGGIISELIKIVINVALTPLRTLVQIVTNLAETFGLGSREADKAAGATQGAGAAAGKAVGFVDKLRNGFAQLRDIIAGVSAAMKFVTDSITRAFTALASFDIKTVIEVIAGLKELPAAYRAGAEASALKRQELELTEEAERKAAEAAEVNARATREAGSADNSRADTLKALRKQAEETAAKLAKVATPLPDVGSFADEQFGFTGDIVAESFTPDPEQVRQASREAVEAILQGFNDEQSRLKLQADIIIGFFNEIPNGIRDGFAGAFDVLNNALGIDTLTQQVNTGKAAFQDFAIAGVAMFGELAVASAGSGKAIVGSMLDTLDAMAPIIAAQIFGLYAASPNPVNILGLGVPGAVAAAAAVAAFKGLVAIARASAGFSEGGYTGNGGVNDIAGVVHGREFVLNANATQKHRALMEHMNRGGDPRAFFIDNNGAKLDRIASLLESIPNERMTRTAADIQVGFDSYLYERDRRRASLRRLAF